MGDKPSKIIDKAIAEFVGVQRPTVKAGTNATKPPKIDLDVLCDYFKSLNIKNDVPDVEHIFTPGTYMRRMVIPAGHMVIGKSHVEPGLNFIPYGKILSYSPEQHLEIEGPYLFTSPPGRKLVYAITETCWCNVIKTELTDVSEIEKKYIHPELESLT